MLGRKEALSILMDRIGDTPVIHCNGYISRESFALSDRLYNFYMIGSMGMASSIGLGVALSRPEQKIVVLDGDGNVLMNLGGLASIGAARPENLYHIVFDNGAYASTGYQSTLSNRVPLEKVAHATGYQVINTADNAETLRSIAKEMLGASGPAFLRIRIDPDQEDNRFGRITHSPEEIKERFMTFLGI